MSALFLYATSRVGCHVGVVRSVRRLLLAELSLGPSFWLLDSCISKVLGHPDSSLVLSNAIFNTPSPGNYPQNIRVSSKMPSQVPAVYRRGIWVIWALQQPVHWVEQYLNCTMSNAKWEEWGILQNLGFECRHMIRCEMDWEMKTTFCIEVPKLHTCRPVMSYL